MPFQHHRPHAEAWCGLLATDRGFHHFAGESWPLRPSPSLARYAITPDRGYLGSGLLLERWAASFANATSMLALSCRIEVEMSTINLRIKTEKLGEGGYVATSPDIPGLVAEGDSLEEVLGTALGLVGSIAEACIEHGDPLPPVLDAILRKAAKPGRTDRSCPAELSGLTWKQAEHNLQVPVGPL